MGPTKTTLLMGLVALLVAAAAGFYYPWPQAELTSDRVGKPLFENVDFKLVRSIDIAQFNAERQTMERLALDRRGEKWTLPAQANFNASNTARIAALINSLSDCRVLQLETDKQVDHLKYGVLDPDELDALASPSGIGQRVAVKDRNQRTLATLIVGQELSSTDGATRRFVRIPGEPQVYVVDYDASVLSTQFRDWVDPNLLQVQTSQSGTGFKFQSLRIDNYRIEPADLATDAKRQPFYRAAVGLSGNQFSVNSLEVPADGEWQSVTATPEQTQALQGAVSMLPFMLFTDVRSKSSLLASALENPAKTSSPDSYQSGIELGFRQTAAVGEPTRFDSTGGEIAMTAESGVRVRAYFGNVIATSQNESKLSRLTLLIAEVAEELLPRPTPPAPPEGGELTEDQKRSAARELEEWQAKMNTARQAAADFNQIHAPWYYAVDEEIVSRLRPELPQLSAGN